MVDGAFRHDFRDVFRRGPAQPGVLETGIAVEHPAIAVEIRRLRLVAGPQRAACLAKGRRGRQPVGQHPGWHQPGGIHGKDRAVAAFRETVRLKACDKDGVIVGDDRRRLPG